MDNGIVKRMSEILSGLKECAVALSPYLMLEVFVPGGTALALLLFWRRRKAGRALLPGKRRASEPLLRDQGAAQPIATMAACCAILVFMLAA